MISNNPFPHSINILLPHLSLLLSKRIYKIPSDAQDVEDAILAFTQDFRINQDVIVNQLFTPINTIAGIIGIEILIGTAPSPTLSDNIPIGTVEKADFDGSRITVNS